MRRLILALAVLLTSATMVFAGEGMWMPQQVPMLGDQLRNMGLQMDPNAFADLTGQPMGAVVSLGGCSASFVSPQGLIVTNHHCGFGALQYNSTPEHDYITNGFLAKTMDEEVPAGPGSRVYVTTSIEDVTDQVTGNISSRLSDIDRYKLIDRREKELVRKCEAEGGVRCRVASFFEGLQYLQIKQMEIRDVRLVYAPARGIGEFGGEIDNWMWPRHTGDWSYLRAYVGKDGKPADYSKDNVPYHPAHILKVSEAGVKPGDLVIVAGYPGRTYRYKTADEVEHAQNFTYPTQIKYLHDLIDIMETSSKANKTAEIRNASRVKGFLNSYKNNQGMLEGLKKGNLIQKRRDLQAQLVNFVKSRPELAKKYGNVFDQIAKLNAEEYQTAQRDAVLGWMFRASPMLSQAERIYRWSVEQKKPDLEREDGYQQRDLPRMKAGIERTQRSIEPATDRASLRYMLEQAVALPADQRIPAVDAALKATGKSDTNAQIEAFLDTLYGNTKMENLDARMAMLGETPDQLKAANDAMIEFAASLFPLQEQVRQRDDRIEGAMSRLRPQYMAALREMAGGRLYPDANGTLRVTFGRVEGYSPRDAVHYTPQTTVIGIVEKDTGEEPFNSPKALLDAISAKKFDGYAEPQVGGTVPVNFLSTVDTTGGNSGSPTLNAKGELCGLLFDGNYESMSSDYLVVPEVTRSIHVDAVYMLWVMDAVDHADNLLREMGLPVKFAK
ncbi:MAG: S46 family peptidase [Thermoanaerobaculia bacterium]